MPVVPALRGRGKQILGPDQPAHLPSPKEKLENQKDSLYKKQKREKPYSITNIKLFQKKKKTKQNKQQNRTRRANDRLSAHLLFKEMNVIILEPTQNSMPG